MKQIQNLKVALQKAIDNDQFELASTLKEDIKTLEVRQYAL
jgi:protein-arginine kinase activator protein McsA